MVSIEHHQVPEAQSLPGSHRSMSEFISEHSFYRTFRVVLLVTSQRRAFERDVYDHARALGLSPLEAKEQVRLASLQCGQRERMDSDEDTCWEDEQDDTAKSSWILNEIAQAPQQALQKFKQDLAINFQIAGTGNEEVPVPSIEKSRDGAFSAPQHPYALVDPDSVPTAGAQEFVPSKKSIKGDQKSKSKSKKSKEERRRHREEKKASKRLRRVQAERERQEEEMQMAQQQLQDQEKGPNDPRTEEEAHENYLRSNAGVSGVALRADHPSDQQRKDFEDQMAFDREVRSTRDFANAKQVELFERGGMKGMSKRKREELQEMKARRDTRSQIDQNMPDNTKIRDASLDPNIRKESKKRKKEKRLGKHQAQRESTFDRVADEAMERIDTVQDFAHPMKQQA